MIFFPDDFFTGLSRVQLGIDIVSGFIFNTKRKNKITNGFGLPKIHFIINWYSSSDWDKKTLRQINRFFVVILFFASLLPTQVLIQFIKPRIKNIFGVCHFFSQGEKIKTRFGNFPLRFSHLPDLSKTYFAFPLLNLEFFDKCFHPFRFFHKINKFLQTRR